MFLRSSSKRNKTKIKDLYLKHFPTPKPLLHFPRPSDTLLARCTCPWKTIVNGVVWMWNVPHRLFDPWSPDGGAVAGGCGPPRRWSLLREVGWGVCLELYSLAVLVPWASRSPHIPWCPHGHRTTCSQAFYTMRDKYSETVKWNESP